jgi:hypothetical protein
MSSASAERRAACDAKSPARLVAIRALVSVPPGTDEMSRNVRASNFAIKRALAERSCCPAKYPVTLFVFGHSRLAANRMIVGNAGAPLDSGQFGYASIVPRPDDGVCRAARRVGVTP